MLTNYDKTLVINTNDLYEAGQQFIEWKGWIDCTIPVLKTGNVTLCFPDYNETIYMMIYENDIIILYN